jgi:hypothetical protein
MSTAIAPTAAPRAALVVHDQGPLSHIFDTAKFEQLQRVCSMLACSAFTPKHLVGRTEKETMANCFRVANQALRWQMDPFSVADETYTVAGRLGYQGKLVAAVVNSRAGLSGRLSYAFTGKGDALTVVVSGTFKDDGEVRTISLSVGQAKTKNDMWMKDPEQKLAYSGAIKWARRHCPEVIQGVLTEDDLHAMAERDKSIEAPKTMTGIMQNLTAPKIVPAQEERPRVNTEAEAAFDGGGNADAQSTYQDDDEAMRAEAYAREQAEASGELFGKGHQLGD